MKEEERKKREEAIEEATEKIHHLFVHNGWKWGGLGLSPEYVPSKWEVEETIRGLLRTLLVERKDSDAVAEGMIEVAREDENFITINLVFQGGYFFSDEKGGGR